MRSLDDRIYYIRIHMSSLLGMDTSIHYRLALLKGSNLNQKEEKKKEGRALRDSIVDSDLPFTLTFLLFLYPTIEKPHLHCDIGVSLLELRCSYRNQFMNINLRKKGKKKTLQDHCLGPHIH